MTRLRLLFLRGFLPCCLLAVCYVGGTAERAGAQATSVAQAEAVLSTAERLARKAHISSDTTRLADIMEALSAQTGLKIQAAACLRERRIVMQVDGLSAAALLDTLAELNDWTWHEVQPGVIAIARRTKPIPQQISAVPPALQAALPADFRRFLIGTGGTRDGMYFERSDAPDLQASSPFRTANQKGMRDAAQQWRDQLCLLLQSDFATDVKIPYSRMNTAQKHALLVSKIFDSLVYSNTTHSHYILMGVLRPYEQDIAAGEITLEGEWLNIRTTKQLAPDHTQSFGFGANVKRVLGAAPPPMP